MNRASMLSAMGLMALGMAGTVSIEPERRAAPQPRRRVVTEPPKFAAHEAKFIGDGFDRDRIEAAERKRARKAAKLAANHPSEDSTK